jgi:hypothetical protein
MKLPGFRGGLSMLSCMPSTLGGEDARCSGLGTRRGIPSESFGGDTFSAVDFRPVNELDEDDVIADEDRGRRGAGDSKIETKRTPSS